MTTRLIDGVEGHPVAAGIMKTVTAHILLARFISPLLQLSKTVAKNSEDGVLPIKYEQLLKTLTLGSLLRLVDQLYHYQYLPYVTTSLRWGVIVKSALANIELEILLLSELAGQMLVYILNTEFMAIDD